MKQIAIGLPHERDLLEYLSNNPAIQKRSMGRFMTKMTFCKITDSALFEHCFLAVVDRVDSVRQNIDFLKYFETFNIPAYTVDHKKS